MKEIQPIETNISVHTLIYNFKGCLCEKTFFPVIQPLMSSERNFLFEEKICSHSI